MKSGNVQLTGDLAVLPDLWAEADAIWEAHLTAPEFRGYVSADYQAVLNAMVQLRTRASTFLECGSGLGVIAIMASLLGFDACGIEAEPLLVDFARDLAEKYGPGAKFAVGSFIPDEFEWDPSKGEEVHITVIDLAAGYDELAMDLDDFDVIYAYPWPTEHQLYHNIMRQFGAKHATLLSYDAHEGILLVPIRQLLTDDRFDMLYNRHPDEAY